MLLFFAFARLNLATVLVFHILTYTYVQHTYVLIEQRVHCSTPLPKHPYTNVQIIKHVIKIIYDISHPYINEMNTTVALWWYFYKSFRYFSNTKKEQKLEYVWYICVTIKLKQRRKNLLHREHLDNECTENKIIQIEFNRMSIVSVFLASVL